MLSRPILNLSGVMQPLSGIEPGTSLTRSKHSTALNVLSPIIQQQTQALCGYYVKVKQVTIFCLYMC